MDGGQGHIRVGDQHRVPDPALHAQRRQHDVALRGPRVRARLGEAGRVDVQPVGPVVERLAHYRGGRPRELRARPVEQRLDGGQLGTREQAHERARPARGRPLGARLRLARQPCQVAEREAELVGAEPFRSVREVVEDRLVQLRHRREESGRGEGRSRAGCLGCGVGRGRRAAIGGSGGVSHRRGLRRHGGLQLVRLAGDRRGRRLQLLIPPDEFGQLSRQEHQHGVRSQVRHLGKLDVGVEGRLARRRANPPSRVEQLCHQPPERKDSPGRRDRRPGAEALDNRQYRNDW